MARKKRKQNISSAERARRRRQARINFGLSRSKTKRGGSRTLARKRRVRRRSSSSSRKSLMKVAVAAGIYGVGRSFLSSFIEPVTSKLPLGSIADEAGMAGLSYIAARKGRGVVKQAGEAGLVIEFSRIGQALVDGSAFATASSQSSNSFGGRTAIVV